MNYAIEKKVEDYVKSFNLDCCNILTEIQKIVLQYKIIDNLSYAEISRKIDRSLPQARNIFIKSIKLLSLYLNEKSPSTHINDSLLSQRIKNCFHNDTEIKCLKDFHNLPLEKLLRRNLGHNSILEINKYIEDLGFSIKFPAKEFLSILDKRFNKNLFSEFSNNDIAKWIYNLSCLLIKKK